MKTIRLTFPIVLAAWGATSPALAQDVALDPTLAAGKTIFEETAGGVGCASCHGMDAKGDVGPDIRGKDPDAIRNQFQVNENMAFIELTDDEVEQVAAYLTYLHDLVAH